ncbi:putative metalloprotease CJM1_0395 family protein, partial [Campylobacter jejuni]
VSIDTAAVPNDPEATLRKMEIVLRAALAPIEPSPQDLRVAALAQAQAAQARGELAEQRREAATTVVEERKAR